MSARRIKAWSLIAGGGAPLISVDENGDEEFNGITGIGSASALGSACEDPSLGEEGTDEGCWIDEDEGDPGLTTRHGWFHRLCTTDKTDPEITPPDNLRGIQQTNRDGWTVTMNWADEDPDADERLIPIATDDIVPRPRVRVRAPGAITDLTQKEIAKGGRLMTQVGTITFPLGITRVSLLAIDCGGNTAAASYTVQVVDTIPPDLDFHSGVDPPDVHVVRIEAESPFGTVVDHAIPEIHEDICDADPVLTSDLCTVCPSRRYRDPDEGGSFIVEACRCTLYNQDFEVDNEHLVSYRSEDFTGNDTHEDFTPYDANHQVLYIIEDTEPPTLAIVDAVKRIEQEQRCGTSLGGDRIPGAFIGDAATPTVLLTLEKFDGHGVGCQRDFRDEPPSRINDDFCFPLGATTVLYIVTDLSGNTTCAEAVIDVVDTTKPTQRLVGGLLPQWYSTPQSITYEFTDICDAVLDVTATPEDNPVVQDGVLYTGFYDRDNHWDVQFSAEDDSGNVTQTDGIAFGIDLRPVEVTFEGIPQVGAIGVVDPTNSISFPAFFDGDSFDTLLSLDDDPNRSGHYSGITRVNMRVDPFSTNIPLLTPVLTWGPIDGTVPPTAPRQSGGLVCSNGDYCTAGQFVVDTLRKGPHSLLIETTDLAGNGPDHQDSAKRGQNFFYFNVFNLQLAFEQAATIVQNLIDDDETPVDARTLLEGIYEEDENGERIPTVDDRGENGWFDMEKMGVLQLIGFSPEAKAGLGSRFHINAYSVLRKWRTMGNPDDLLPNPEWAETRFRTIGNVLLFLADMSKKLRLAGEFVNTAGILDNLTRGAIAEMNLYLKFAFDTVDEFDLKGLADLRTARGYRNAAIQDHDNGAHNQSMLELMNSLFAIENALFSVEVAHPDLESDNLEARLDDTKLLSREILEDMRIYRDTVAYNNRPEVRLFRDVTNRSQNACQTALANPNNPFHQFCIDRIYRFTATGERDLGGGLFAIIVTGGDDGLFLSEEAWLHHLLEFVDYNRTLDRLSGVHHVWSRYLSWKMLHITKYIFSFARLAACRQHLTGRTDRVEPLCPNFAGHDHLNEARCRNSEALVAFSQREVDGARRIVIGAECLLRYAFQDIYNTYEDRDGNLATRECWNAVEDRYDSVDCDEEGENCEECPADTCLSRRYRCDQYPQLVYPPFPVCPQPENLLQAITSDAEDIAPQDDIPDYFTCDGVVYCPDNRPPVPAHLPPGAGGSCDADRFDVVGD